MFSCQTRRRSDRISLRLLLLAMFATGGYPSVHGDANVLASWIEHEKSQGQKVVLVGWSYGVVQALDAMKLLESRHVRVDTFVCIDCFWLNWHRGDDLQPSNVDRVVLIYREHARLPEGFCNPVVHRIDTWRHLTVAGNRHTVDVLFQETIRLGGSPMCPVSPPRDSPLSSHKLPTSRPPHSDDRIELCGTPGRDQTRGDAKRD